MASAAVISHSHLPHSLEHGMTSRSPTQGLVPTATPGVKRPRVEQHSQGPTARKQRIEGQQGRPVSHAAFEPARYQQESQMPSREVQNGPSTTSHPQQHLHDEQVLNDTLSLQRYRHCRHIGPSSVLDPSLLGLKAFGVDNQARIERGELKRVADDVFFDMLPDAGTADHEYELQALYQVEQIVAPHGPALVELYFEMVHPSFPIIHKRVFVERHRHGDRQFSAALLASMYLLALRWWRHDPDLAQYAVPSSQALELVATKSLGHAMQRPKLSSLQAGLLLLQRHRPNAWPLTVQLTSLAQDLGLHLDCSEWSIPVWERQLRKRLAWAVFMQDKWSSLIFGRPSHIYAANWGVSQLDLKDFDESMDEERTREEGGQEDDDETEDQTNVAIFLQYVELTSIMSEVIDTFYTQVGMTEIARAGVHATQLILSKAKPVQIKLKDWFARLPAELKPDSFEVSASALAGHLQLAYFATEICIHRRIVQSLADSGGTRAANSYALYMCRTAAKTRLISAMDFVNRLKPEHLDAFWYFPSASNFALIATFGNLLRATAPGYEEATFYEMRLREYRWALSASARRADWIGYAVRLLDVTSRIVADLPEKPRSGDVTPASEVDSGREVKVNG